MSPLDSVAEYLAAIDPGHPLRIAVDGITAAGKTTFANRLGQAVVALGRPVIRLSMDGYHHPRAHRYRQGRGSARGYYEDAYDFPSFARLVLDPLGPGGDRRYRQQILDLQADAAVDEPPVLAEPDAVLIVDGSFLQRGELASRWDEVVYLDASFEAARARGSQRDAALLGGPDAARKAFDQRYHAACRFYLDEVGPAARASVVVDNNDVERPVVLKPSDHHGSADGGVLGE